MIGFLRGSVQEAAEGRMLLSVGGDDGAVGYQVSVPSGAAYSPPAVGRPLSLFIYTHVREDLIDLYGFATRAEKEELFLALLSVTGIGPKGALGILSGGEPADLVGAIIGKDKDYLTRIPGVGKKTAERVVLELADSLAKKMEAGLVARPGKPATSLGRPARPDVVQDARDALVGLGFREQDVIPLLQRIVSGLPQPPERAEQLVKTALQQLN